MTVIAVDSVSGTMAADKQSTFTGLRRTTCKIRKLRDGRLAGAAGNASVCRALINWAEFGSSSGGYPDVKEECTLVILNPDRTIDVYDGLPTAIRLEDKFTALGSGRDYAIAAMHLGHSPRVGVEIACKYENSCGHGVDEISLEG